MATHTFTITLDDETLADFVKTARKKAAGDAEDFNAYDYSGGNFDDAYDQGVTDQTIWGMQFLLDLLGYQY